MLLLHKVLRPIKDLPQQLAFQTGDSNWVVVLPTITKQKNNRIHSSTKLSPMQCSLKTNEGNVYRNLLHKRKKIKPKFKMGNIGRTAELKKAFSKGDISNRSYMLIEFTKKNINDTIPSYYIDSLTERYNEALLKNTE